MNASASPLRLGTRGSALARWQADWVSRQLSEAGVPVEMVLITTEGDVRKGSIGSLGGQGVFTKAIQDALLDASIDLAVHSLKDLPTDPIEGLSLAAVPAREDCRDVLVAPSIDSFDSLPSASRIGTGSMRRRAQLLYLRNDLQVLDIRGNVDTRLRHVDEGRYDAIVLAHAGLKRLGLAQRITQVFPCETLLPAIGQGALGLEIRTRDEVTAQRVALLNDPDSCRSVLAERALLAELRGGCLAPVGAWARIVGRQLVLDAVVLSEDGRERLSVSRAGPAENAEQLGKDAARELIQSGADRLIQAAREEN